MRHSGPRRVQSFWGQCMDNVIGTNSNDILFFQGQVQHLTLTLVNAYSGQSLDIDDDYNVNTASYNGLNGTDSLFMTNLGDAVFLTDTTGVQMLLSIERFIAGDGGDIIDLSHSTITLGNIFIDGGNSNDILWGNVGNDTIRGFDGDDTIDGGPGNDTLLGQNDNDTISGGAGNDSIDGGAGIDTVSYAFSTAAVIVNLTAGTASDGLGGSDTLLSIENVIGSAYNDSITGNGLANVLSGGAGDDTINGAGGNDTLSGGDGNDTVSGGTGNDVMNGGAGDDVLNGDDGDDTVSGGAGADTVNGGVGADTLNGEDGDDTIDGGLDNDIVSGGVGSDNLSGGDGNDTVSGGADNDTINGGAGDDALNGDDGDDTVNGGTGADMIYGGAGADILDGEEGDDTIDGGLDNDTVNGGADNDTIDGGAGDDVLNGDDGDDNVSGGTGADMVYGGTGADILRFTSDIVYDGSVQAYNSGSPGIDGTGEQKSASGRSGTFDVFNGGDGYDTLVLTSGNDAFFLYDDNHAFHSSGTALRLIGVEQIDAGDGNDIVDLTHTDYSYGDIVINGGTGDDLLWSSTGNDMIDGGDGADNLWGGVGNDTLYGGAGDDYIVGGPDADSGAIQLTVTDHHFTNNVMFPNVTETVSIMDLVPPGTNALGIAAGDLSVDYATTAEITFVQTVAGYKNTLGYYNIAQDGTMQFAEIAFSNMKNYAAGSTATIDLPGAPNTDFGFFIISDGATKNNFSAIDLAHGTLQFVYMQNSAHERAATIYDPWNKINLVYTDAVGHETKLLGNIFHTTLRDGGTNLNSDGDVHAVSGVVDSGDSTSLRIGFEDLKHTGDADYNDVVFDVKIAGKTTETLLVDDSDILYGGAGNDIIDGGVGDDILIGGAGADTLYGGQGQDTFVFDTMDGFADTVEDFHAGAGGDVLNITDLLQGFDPLAGAISDFVQLVNGGGNTELRVNADGDAGGVFTAVAIIEGGIGGATLADMINNGNLVANQAAL